MAAQEATTAQATPVQQTTKAPFNPEEIKRAYTTSQWQQKEDWYVKEVNSINITPAPSTADIQRFASEIDRILTIARLDYAFINQAYDRYSMQLKIEERRDFVTLKQQPPAQFAGMKLTVDDMKGVVAVVIKQNGWNGGKLSLYDLVEMSSQRNIFMEGVIKTLQDKKDLLITHSGMMKIDHTVTNFQGSVPETPKDYKDSREG